MIRQRHSTRLVVTLCLGLLLGRSVAQSNSPPSPSPIAIHTPIYLTLRIRPDVKSATLGYLDTVTVPRKVEVKPGTSLKYVLASEYGWVSTAVAKMVKANNLDTLGFDFCGSQPSFGKKQLCAGSDELLLPPGPTLSVGLTVEPKSTLTVRQIAQLETGNSGKKTKQAIETLNPSLVGRWDTRVREKVKLPYATHFVSYQLKTPSVVEAKAIAERVKSSDSAVLVASVSYGLEAVPSWSLSSDTAGASCQSTDHPRSVFDGLPDDWTELDKKRIGAAVIAIVDTGIAAQDDRFPYWQNPAPGVPGETDPLTKQCMNDVYGCNFLDLDQFPLDDCTEPSDLNHGTHIAGLASGRQYSHSQEFNDRVRLMILKVADSHAQVSPDNIAEAIRYALPRNANIVNLSLTGPPGDNIVSAVSGASNMLFVAAAGNPRSGKGADLDDDSVAGVTGFPATLTRKFSDNVISVASDNGDGVLSCFSNFGNTSVDLTAPGVGLVSTIAGRKTAILNGTSQATALVSLAAGVLYSQGLTTPAAIKRRILASVDYSPSLVNKVFSAGSLNLAKAIQFKQDLIQFKDKHLEAGEILSPLKISVFSKVNDIPLRGRIYKIVPNFSDPDDPAKKIRVMVVTGGKLVQEYTDRIGTISFRTGNVTKQISINDLVDIIPRQPFGQNK